MELVKAHFFIEEVDGEAILKKLEKAGRVCYKSESKIADGTAPGFIRGIAKRGHESVIEHSIVTVVVVCDRGVTHEIVRHRIGSYSQESTRYCNYKSLGVMYIEPFFFLGEENLAKYEVWLEAMKACEKAYLRLIELGATPQEARTVLPNSLKTEIVITYNLREWRHFFRLRTSSAAHPQMREVAIPLLREFQKLIPVLFEDIEVKVS